MTCFELEKNGKKCIVYGDHFKDIYEKFSVSNPGAQFAKLKNRFIPNRIYSITKAGRFNIGMFYEILNYVKILTSDIRIDEKIYDCFKSLSNTPIQDTLGTYTLRDYQKDAVLQAFEKGRGVIVVATAGGKTLTMASLLTSLYNANNKLKSVIIVPDRGLVSQTFKDFIDYKVPFTFSKWTGADDLDQSTNIVITNLGILQSKNSDTSWMKSIDVLIWDEIHKCRKSNALNDLFKDIDTHHRFGFTGTMPPSPIDCWNIIGHIGPIIYEKTSTELRKDGFIANVAVYSLLLKYKSVPKYSGNSTLPAAKYRAELEFLINNQFRNTKIASLSQKFTNNSLILVDFIEHGVILTDVITKAAPNKRVYFIRGEVEIEDRDKIKQLIENNKDIVIVAISKIFSTGISIKNLHYLVFAGGGKAKIKTLQSIGRGLRLHADKQQLSIFDLADMTEYGQRHYTERKKIYDSEKISNKEIEIFE